MSYFYPPTIDLTDDIAAMTNREQQEAEDALVWEDCDDRDGIPQLLQDYDDEREAALEDEAYEWNTWWDNVDRDVTRARMIERIEGRTAA